MNEIESRTNYEIDYVVSNTPRKELYYQLAEEACELAQAALKINRSCNPDNPTPLTRLEALGNLIEEYTDLLMIAENMLGLQVNKKVFEEKANRWYRRLKDAKEASKDGHNENHTDMDR